jgi:Putative auto-transporter adhesin, head GIN domain
MKSKYLISTALSTALVAATALTVEMSVAATSEQSRDLSGFSTIESEGFIDVEVRVGSAHSVTVVVEDELQQYIITEVHGDTLEIATERRSWRHFRDYDYDGNDPIKVIVTLPALDSFRSSGSGDATIEGLDADDFRFASRGSGDLVISGTCNAGRFTSRGSGDVDGRALNCGNTELSIQGSGDFKMNVAGTIEVGISGSGDVDLNGTCDEGSFSIRGSGDLDGRGLDCAAATIRIGGSGDVELTVNGEVDLEISGSGSVDLYGEAQLRRMHMRGSGEVEIH